MTDIGLLWDTKLLFEKFFTEHGFDCKLIHPASLGTPFLPEFKLLIIPTGFANTDYSSTLSSLMRSSHRIEKFIKNGGMLLVYGALTESHNYEWLPVNLEYIQRYGPVELFPRCQSDVSLLAGDTSLDCDGFFCSADGECIFLNDLNEVVLVEIKYKKGMIIATTIHEFPTPEFIRWALKHSTHASI